MRTPSKSKHRLSHIENNAGARCISNFGVGDVVVREGTPCMIVRVAERMDCTTTTAICNLQTGAVWEVQNSEQVWPAEDVVLTFTTMRRV